MFCSDYTRLQEKVHLLFVKTTAVLRRVMFIFNYDHVTVDCRFCNNDATKLPLLQRIVGDDDNTKVLIGYAVIVCSETYMYHSKMYVCLKYL